MNFAEWNDSNRGVFDTLSAMFAIEALVPLRLCEECGGVGISMVRHRHYHLGSRLEECIAAARVSPLSRKRACHLRTKPDGRSCGIVPMAPAWPPHSANTSMLAVSLATVLGI